MEWVHYEKFKPLSWNRPIREAKNGHVTDFMGQFQGRVLVYARILFIGSGPGTEKLLTRSCVYLIIKLPSASRRGTRRAAWSQSRPNRAGMVPR